MNRSHNTACCLVERRHRRLHDFHDFDRSVRANHERHADRATVHSIGPAAVLGDFLLHRRGIGCPRDAATLAQAPLILGAEVSPGTHVDLVGAFRPTMREADAALLARARLVVDTRAGCLAEAGDLVQALAEGAFGPDHIAADLAELCRGETPGRTDPAQVTVFKSVGWAGEDLAAAILAYEAGRQTS